MNLTIILSFLTATLILPSFHAKRNFNSGSERDGIFSDFRLTHDWGLQKAVQCPQTQYATGASIRTSKIPYSRLTSISTIRLQCSDRIRGKSSSPSIQVGKYYEETSDWQSTQECTRGFVVGYLFYLSPRPTDESGEMGTGSYVSGFKLVCQEGQWAVISNQTSSPASTLLFGVAFGIETARVCSLGHVMRGFGVRLKSVITLEDGESLFPSDQMIRCGVPTHPFVGCEIELEFEPVSDYKCSPYAEREYSLGALMENYSLGSDTENITCNYRTITGAKLNEDIDNLKDITFAYESTGIKTTNGSWVAYTALLKTEELEFKREWANVPGKEKIPPLDPQMIWETFAELSEFTQNVTLFNSDPRKTLTFMNLAELSQRNNAKEQADVKLVHSIKLEQLVGYCSVLKLYFPVVRKKVTGFIREKKGGIKKIIEFV